MEERNSHIDELIAAFLSKGLSKEVREELDAWIASSEENRRYFMQQQEIWFSAVQEEERTRYDADRAFETFRKRVAASTAQKQSKKVIDWKQSINMRLLCWWWALFPSSLTVREKVTCKMR